MSIANPQNLSRGPEPTVRPYGICVKLRRGDPFSLLVGNDWQKLHWYATARDRDEALADMSRRHEFSRLGDQPALAFEKVEQLAGSRSR